MVDDADRQSVGQLPPQEQPGISIDNFLSARIGEEGATQKFDPEAFVQRVLARDITIITDDLGEDSEGVVRDENTKAIVLDSKRLDTMMFEIMETFTSAHEAGTLREHPALGRMMEGVSDQTILEMYQKLRTALDMRDVSNPSLANLDTNLPLRTIAERQMIKDKLITEIEQMPVHWKTVTAADGGTLDQETEIEYLLVQEGEEFKLVVASARGIDALDVKDPATLDPETFTLTSAKKEKNGSISLTIGKNKSGKTSLVQSVVIVKDRLNDRLRTKLTESARTKREIDSQFASTPSRPQSTSTNWVNGPSPSSTPRFSS